MTTKYSAQKSQENGQITVADASPGVSTLLDHLGRRKGLLHRTSSGMHYRLAAGLAPILGVEVVNPPGNHPTIPPTELVPVDALVQRLHECITSGTVGTVASYTSEIQAQLETPHANSSLNSAGSPTY